MKTTRLLVTSMLMVGACDSELGPPDTDELAYQPLGTVQGDPKDEFEPGPDPFEEGENRLSLGVFYEGGASDVYEVDNESAFFYIYSSTFSVVTSSEKAEGTYSDELVHSGQAWWGGGIHFDPARDLSMWKTLYISLRSESESMNTVAIHMAGDAEVKQTAADYGFVADGEWHHLEIPLSNFTEGGVDLTQITGAVMLIGEGGQSGDSIFVDNVYFTDEDR